MPASELDKHGRPVVVVTGTGILTSLGEGKEDNWQALTAGRSGILPATSSSSLVRIASLNCSRSLIGTTKAPGPPITQSS